VQISLNSSNREGGRMKKTALEHFQDIKELEVADGPEITVEDLLPYKCEQVEKSLKALEIIKEKYPNVVEVKLCKNYEHYKLRMSSKHDTEIVKIDWNDKSLLDYLKLLTEEEFNLLKEVLE
jgi:uncharacterized protein YbbC (DUF1343 family)